MSDPRDRFKVGNVDSRVADCFEVHTTRFIVDGLSEVFRIGLLYELGVNAELGKRVMKKIVCATVKTGRRNDVLSALSNIEDRQRFRRLT